MVTIIENKNDLVLKLGEAGDKLVVLDFFAPWCGACKTIAPQLEKCATDYPDIVIFKINVEENEDIAQEYQIMFMPTIVLIKKNQVIQTLYGSKYEKVVAKIKELIQKKE